MKLCFLLCPVASSPENTHRDMCARSSHRKALECAVGHAAKKSESFESKVVPALGETPFLSSNESTERSSVQKSIQVPPEILFMAPLLPLRNHGRWSHSSSPRCLTSISSCLIVRRNTYHAHAVHMEARRNSNTMLGGLLLFLFAGVQTGHVRFPVSTWLRRGA